MSSMVTLMVKLRKLTGNLITFVAVTRGKSVLQTNGLLEGTSVFGRFWATKSYQISPLFAKNVHRRGSNTALRAGFARPIQLKRVKPSGPCQSVIGAHFAIAKEPPTQRHGGTEKNGKRWETRDILISSSVSSLCLRSFAVNPSRLQRPFGVRRARPQVCEANLLIRRWLIANSPSGRSHGMTESKGLTSRAFFPPGERKVIFFASRRATETRRWQSTDSARVDRELAGEN